MKKIILIIMVMMAIVLMLNKLFFAVIGIIVAGIAIVIYWRRKTRCRFIEIETMCLSLEECLTKNQEKKDSVLSYVSERVGNLNEIAGVFENKKSQIKKLSYKEKQKTLKIRPEKVIRNARGLITLIEGTAQSKIEMIEQHIAEVSKQIFEEYRLYKREEMLYYYHPSKKVMNQFQNCK